jgi:hypothetical protein
MLQSTKTRALGLIVPTGVGLGPIAEYLYGLHTRYRKDKCSHPDFN